MSEVKGTRVLKHEVNDTGVVFTVKDALVDGDGNKVPGVLVLELASLSPEVKHQALLHGLVQRVADRAAMSRDSTSGKSATPEEKFLAMKVLVEHYNSGATAWNLSGVERGPSDEQKLLVSALGEVYTQKTAEELTAWVKKRSKEDLSALLQSEKLKPIIERFRAERSKGVDSEALLSELN